MAGSVGNVINVVDLLQKHNPETVRFLLLGTHYRSPIEWTDDRLAEVRRSLDSFYRFFERYERITKESFYAVQAPTKRNEFDTGGNAFLAQVGELRQSFLNCMDDDFNTGGAVGALYELLTALNRYADSAGLETGKATEQSLANFRRGVLALRELSQLLGLFWQPPKQATDGNDGLVSGLVEFLIELRADARKAKNFALGDQIRKRLAELGVTLEDRLGGTGWRRG